MRYIYILIILASVIFEMGVAFPTLATSAIEDVEALPKGKVSLHFENGSSTVYSVFSTQSKKIGNAAVLNDNYAVMLRHDGKKIALINRQGKAKITALDIDKGFSSQALKITRFDDDDAVVVIGKRASLITLALFEKDGKQLELADSAEFHNNSIQPSKTKISANAKKINLKNSQGNTITSFSVLNDLLLLQTHSAVACADGWYETHAHMEEADGLTDYIERLDNHSIGCSLLFIGLGENENDLSTNDEYDELVAIIKNNPGRFLPFFSSDPQTVADISEVDLQTIIDVDEHTILRGLGEYAFYQEPLSGTLLTSNPWPAVFEFAADHNLIIMIHLNADQGDELDAMLDTYPNTQVLLHGKELATTGDLSTLLANHSNLYYTLDTANLLQVDGIPIMFPVQGGADDDVSDKERADEFVAAYDANEADMLLDAEETFTDIFFAAPDQILWGTDAAFTWHFRKPVYSRLIEFSEQFMDRLEQTIDSSYIDGYQQDNAENFLGNGKIIE